MVPGGMSIHFCAIKTLKQHRVLERMIALKTDSRVAIDYGERRVGSGSMVGGGARSGTSSVVSCFSAYASSWSPRSRDSR